MGKEQVLQALVSESHSSAAEQKMSILPTPAAFTLRCGYIPAMFTVDVALWWPVAPSLFPKLCRSLRMMCN